MSVLELPSRVAQLEQQLAAALDRIQKLEQRPTPSTLQPNVLTDINGQIGAQFSGLVDALGIIIPASLGGQPAQANQIRWTDPATGLTYASVWTSKGSLQFPSGQIFIIAYAPTATSISQAELAAYDDTGQAQALLEVSQNARGNAAIIISFPQALSRYTLLDDQGRSDLALTSIKAAAATAGAAALPANPQGFIVTKDSAGNTLKIPYYNA